MTKYKSIFISDIHLGTNDSKIKQCIKFLKENKCDNLFLNGDIIDAWNLKSRGKWKKKDTRFFRLILKLISSGTNVVYIRGNHDDFLESIYPIHLDNFQIVENYVYETNGKKYFIVHGDIFDSITSKQIWLSKLGDLGYYLLLKVNKWYNIRRIKKGLPYYSISKDIKKKVKMAIDFLDGFEKKAAEYAINNKYDGIICGHVHTPVIKEIDGITYYNSGDWVESLSAICEKDGVFKLKYFER